jgi:GMP synthase (glutamine-hydrolysing)
MNVALDKPVLVLRHTHCVGPAYWDNFAGRRQIESVQIELDKGSDLPWDLKRFSAVVVLGGAMNVYEESAYPFLKPENDWIQLVVACGMPYLGICLGGQLLAKAMGGRVTRHSIREIGLTEIELTADGERDPLFTGFPKNFEFCQWHQDTFSELPSGAVLLARGKRCPHQAFRYGRVAYGLQFHPETTSSLLEVWRESFKRDLESSEQGAQIVRHFAENEKNTLLWSERLFENFLALAAGVSRSAH